MSTEELLEIAESELKIYKHISYGTARLLLDTMYGFMPEQPEPEEVFYEDATKYELTPEDWMIGVDDYCILIDTVRDFDRDAANKLVDMAKDKTVLNFNFGNKIISAFPWSSTADGWEYWRAINAKLDQLAPIPKKQYRIVEYFDNVRVVAKFDMVAFHSLLKMPFLSHNFNYGPIDTAFVWNTTNEGHDYWERINSELVRLK